jgi:hypothetical protein
LQKLAFLTFFRFLRDFGSILGFHGFLGHFSYHFQFLGSYEIFTILRAKKQKEKEGRKDEKEL